MFIIGTSATIYDAFSPVVAGGQIRDDLKNVFSFMPLVDDDRLFPLPIDSIEDDWHFVLVAKDKKTMMSGLLRFPPDCKLSSAKGRNLGIIVGGWNREGTGAWLKTRMQSDKSYNSFKKDTSFFGRHKMMQSVPNRTARKALKEDIQEFGGQFNRENFRKAFNRSRLVDRAFFVLVGEAEKLQGQGAVILHQSQVPYSAIPPLVKGKLTAGQLLSNTVDQDLNDLINSL